MHTPTEMSAAVFDVFVKYLDAHRGELRTVVSISYDRDGNVTGSSVDTDTIIYDWRIGQQFHGHDGYQYTVAKLRVEVMTEADGSSTTARTLYGFKMKKSNPTERKSVYMQYLGMHPDD